MCAPLLLFLERSSRVGSLLQEGMKQQAFSQFLFLLFLGDDLRLLGAKRPCALRALRCGLRLDAKHPWSFHDLALWRMSHKFFLPQVDQFFLQFFQLLFQQAFLLFVASFDAVLPVNFAAIFPITSPNPSPTISPVSGSLSLLSISIFSLYNNCQGNVNVI